MSLEELLRQLNILKGDQEVTRRWNCSKYIQLGAHWNALIILNCKYLAIMMGTLLASNKCASNIILCTYIVVLGIIQQHLLVTYYGRKQVHASEVDFRKACYTASK